MADLTAALQQKSMVVTGEDVAELPEEAIVRERLLQTKRAALGGLVGKEKGSQETLWQQLASNGGVRGDGGGLQKQALLAEVGFCDGEEVERLEDGGKAM